MFGDPSPTMTDINPEDVPTLSDRTLLERTRVFFGHAAGNMFSIVVAGVLIAVVLRSAGVGDTALMAWFSGLVLASVAVIFYEAWVHGQPLETVATARRVLRWRMALRHTGQNGPLLGGGRKVSVALLRTSRVSHSACLARKISTLSWPDSMACLICQARWMSISSRAQTWR